MKGSYLREVGLKTRLTVAKRSKLILQALKKHPSVVKRLRQVQKHILEEPRRLRMYLWVQKSPSWTADAPPCGTTACIAGWYSLLRGYQPTLLRGYYTSMMFESVSKGNRTVMVPHVLINDLGLQKLNSKQVGESVLRHLYIVDHWPLRFRRAYNQTADCLTKAKVTADRALPLAQITAARLDYFIQTGR